MKLIRRFGISEEQIRQLENLPDAQKARMWRLAHKWWVPIEFSHMKDILDGLQQGVKAFKVKLPWGKVRAVQEFSRLALRDIIRQQQDPLSNSLLCVKFISVLGPSRLDQAENLAGMVKQEEEPE